MTERPEGLWNFETILNVTFWEFIVSLFRDTKDLVKKMFTNLLIMKLCYSKHGHHFPFQNFKYYPAVS